MKHLLLIFASFVFSPLGVFSQKTEYKYTHFNMNAGLSNNFVKVMIQDHEGFVWFGTQDGLNRFDGKNFIIYRHERKNPASIIQNYVSAMCVDKKGRLWIGTGGGLSMFDQETNRFVNYTHEDADPNSISQNSVNAIIEDQTDNLWVGTADGLNHFDVKTRRFKQFYSNPSRPGGLISNSIRCLTKTSNGTLWIGTNKGLIRMAHPGVFENFREQEDINSPLFNSPISEIKADKFNNIWIGTEKDGLYCYVAQSKTFKNYKKSNEEGSLSHNTILSIQPDAKGDVWVGTENGGLNILRRGTRLFEIHQLDYTRPSGLNSNSIHDLFSDREGNIWIGTFNGGVNLLNYIQPKFTHLNNHLFDKESLSDNNVRCFAALENDKVLVGTDGGGINQYNATTKKFDKLLVRTSANTSLPSNYINCLLKDKDGDVWVGTYGAEFSMYNPKTKTFRRFPADGSSKGTMNFSIMTICQDKIDGSLWLGCLGGFSRFDKKTNSFEHFKVDFKNKPALNIQNVSCLYDDGEELWIGTGGGGLYVLNKKTRKVKIFKPIPTVKGSISYNIINAVFKDSAGRIWVGTYDGLNLYNPVNQSFKTYYVTDGLPHNSIMAITEDSHGNLWISTNKGISKFNFKSNKFRNYGLADGLQGASFNKNSFLKMPDGRMLFGGQNGFNVFHPDSVKQESSTPKVFLTEFKIFNRPIVVAAADSILTTSPLKIKEIVLSHTQSSFSFDFVALNYVSSDMFSFAYQLEGLENNWTTNSTGTATYTNITPGEYTFKVKAVNMDGLWSSPIMIRVTVQPPFWLTWWFKLGTILLVSGIIILIFRSRVKAIHSQKNELENQVKVRTAEVRYNAEKLSEQTEVLQIVNQELIEKSKEAEAAKSRADEANRAKSDFLATMSHEIRTPMNGVLGMAALLAETPLTQEQKDYVSIITSSGDNLLSVINDILDFSKIEGEMMKIEKHEFEITQLVESVLDVFATKINQQGLNLIYQIDPAVPSGLVGDSHRLRQILLNLISNAVKFTHKGEVVISVYKKFPTSPNFDLCFDIKDTGIGVPESRISGLFQPFTQVDSSTTRKYGGTGLGLTICQRLVKLMGGDVTVTSTEGVGTTFSFFINVDVAENVQSATFEVSKLDSRKVLLIDENQAFLNALEFQLRRWNLEPVVTSSGVEAISLLQKERFDLIICDKSMPNWACIDVGLEAKKNVPEIPVLLLSYVGDNSINGQPQLFSSVLCKPVKYSQLYSSIISCLKISTDGPENKQIFSTELNAGFSRKHPLKILIAEDNLINQKLATKVLTKLGYEPEIANNGIEAVRKQRENSYDVILMDVLMPEMDGLQATQMIRSSEFKQPTIVAMTANALPEDADICIKAGMDYYISKPFNRDVLIEILIKISNHTKPVSII
ncbi:MAG TPA: two-component regulator propeller domain-containing protein [Pedobacter sp.]